jgi:hypothetical protein
VVDLQRWEEGRHGSCQNGNCGLLAPRTAAGG